MPSSGDDIAQRFERFNDAELLDLLRSGDLTELARELAVAELSRRGVDLPAIEPRAPVPSPPQSPAGLPALKADWTPGRVLWWLYFGVFAIALPVHVELMASQGAYTTEPTWPLNYLSTTVDGLGVVGLYGYIRRLPLLTEGFWQVLFTVYVGKLAIGAVFFVYNLSTMPETHGLYPWRRSTDFWVSTLGLLGLVFAAPLLFALFRYAFCSRTANASPAPVHNRPALHPGARRAGGQNPPRRDPPARPATRRYRPDDPPGAPPPADSRRAAARGSSAAVPCVRCRR